MKSLNKILDLELINSNGLIILETDDEERILEDIKHIKVKIVDKRKYGRATIIFLKNDA